LWRLDVRNPIKFVLDDLDGFAHHIGLESGSIVRLVVQSWLLQW
jgi:hypothetical protein